MKFQRIFLALLIAMLSLAFLVVSCSEDDEEATNTPPNVPSNPSPADGSDSLATNVGLSWTCDDPEGDLLTYAVYLGTVADPPLVDNSGRTTPSFQSPQPLDTNITHYWKVIALDDKGMSTEGPVWSFTTGANPANFQASGQFTSESNGTIETTSGAHVTIPVGAVPLTTDGHTGTMVFSIERDAASQANPPAGETMITDIYRFGPDGFVFARPVEIGIPFLGEGDPRQLKIYRVNPTTLVPELKGGVYDEATNTIIVQTYELSDWFGSESDPDDMVWGCIHVTNSSNEWLYLCVEEYNFTYPGQDGNSTELNSLWAPSGTIGWVNEGDWFVPQGTYTICRQMLKYWAENSCAADSCFEHDLVTDVAVLTPWHYNNQQCTDLSVYSLSNPEEGRCECTPIPTPSVGTGDIQVTLTWHNAQSIDLDLWVTDPDSERCWYLNKTTTSGGELDRDNLCYNYINGRPENIYWSTAPNGEYVVEVDWFWDCDNGMTSQTFDVRIVAAGQTNTYNGTIHPDETLEITRFTMGPTIFGPYSGRVVKSKLERPPKKMN